MRHVIETGTDGATVCFFDPAALPAEFDTRIEDDAIGTFEELEKEARFWWQETGRDGGCLFHFYVDTEVPEEVRRHSHKPREMGRFLVPSGVIWAAGAEYAARDPERGNASTPKGGLARYSRMGARFECAPGEYHLTAWRTKWPKGMVEREVRRRVGKTARLGLNLSIAVNVVLFICIFFGSLAAIGTTLMAAFGHGRQAALGASRLLWLWSIPIASALLCWPLLRWSARLEQDPARQAIEREFPSIVVHMRRIST